jgi:hypothetical protein
MNVNWANHIDDANKIEPQQLIDYLEKHEWIKQNYGWEFKRKVEIYQKIVDGGLYQIAVPMSRELSDYASAMLRAVVEIINSEEAKRVRQITQKLIFMPQQNNKEVSK